LSKVDDDVLKKFIVDPAPSAKVKVVLQQVLDQRRQLEAVTQDLADKKAAYDILTKDQARVRDNLKIVPQTSEHYKEFLTKFVNQEKQIEDSQRQIRTQEAELMKLKKEYEAFVTAVTVQ
jgi:hypothetical protein